jgi:hypothetical protein
LRDSAVSERKLGRLGAKVIGKPQPPHQQNCAQHAVIVPAAARRHSRRGDAAGPRQTLELARQRDVFHQWQIGKAADRPKRRSRDENRLVAGGDAGEPRAPIDHPGYEREQRMPAGDAQVETAPSAIKSAAQKRARN